MLKQNKNEKLLKSFTKYCIKHKEERFWQSLRNWSRIPFIYASKDNINFLPNINDTFYWEEKRK